MTSAAEIDPRLLGDMPYRERRVLEMRFGLSGERAHSFEEVGRVFAVSGDRVREIETAALEALRERSVEPDWKEAETTLRMAADGFLDLDARLDLIVYGRRPDPEDARASLVYLCPPTPAGVRLETQTRPGEAPRWRHVREEAGDGGPADAVRA